MRARAMREGLVSRVEEILGEIKNRIRIEGACGKEFWTARGVRQGCPLSPLLFNLLVADLEEEMGKVKWEGIMLGGERVYTLAYADDMVLLAENEGEMRSLLERSEGYLDRKRLVLNDNKTKIKRFRKEGGRLRKVDWRWKDKVIEEVNEFRYLGYVMQRSGGQQAHVREKVRRAALVISQVWGIGKRRFGGIGRVGYGCLTDWCGRYWGMGWRFGVGGRKWKRQRKNF